MNTTNAKYTADDIQVLEGLEPVRKRPGMYIGSTDINGLQHLITEIVNNSMDEAIAGSANHIRVTLHEDNSVSVYDNGRGIPYGIKKGYNVPAVQLAFTKLHAGGKFGGGGYKVSSGLHGVGASVVNALSDWCRVIIINKPNKEVVMQEYEKGADIINPLEKINESKPKTKLSNAPWTVDFTDWNYPTGTIVQFKPSGKIFETTEYKIGFFMKQLKEYAFLTAGIKFELIDHRDGSHYTYYFEGGVKTYLRSLNKNKKAINNKVFYIKKEVDDVLVEVAMQYNDSFAENIVSFANHIKTGEGGTHLTGFRGALTRTINDYARKYDFLKEKDANFSGDDLKEGLTAVVSVNLESSDLQFEGQTKGKLGNSHVKPITENVVKEALDTYFEENPKEAQAIMNKNVIAMKARIAAKAARDTVIRKSIFEGGGVLPGKLADCSSKKTAETELYIVEGDSAGGSAKAARNRSFQAILPVFGKVLNTERARLDKVVESAKFKDLIVAIGTGIGDQYTNDKLRYGKLILMSDADVDGSHIMTLNLTFFFRHLPQLIEEGHVYLAVPPLYKATWGKNKKYLFEDADREAFLKLPEGKGAIIQRFKGLGEMNAEELWETTMNPETRRLKKINVEDAAFADEVFSTLMGDEVLPRRKFIQTHAKNANIDLA
ncbi:DNA gyrase subunit B [candidate division WWE3 bacterium]|nr:DNA gyrase subunit B [candidate division WWE3 bacterium]